MTAASDPLRSTAEVADRLRFSAVQCCLAQWAALGSAGAVGAAPGGVRGSLGRPAGGRASTRLETSAGSDKSQDAGATAGVSPVPSVVDPEALVLLSAVLSPGEPRLDAALAWWAVSGPRLLSVQRLKALAGGFPPCMSALVEFGARAWVAGDRRWFSSAASVPSLPGGPPADGPPPPVHEPSLRHPSALLLRLRAGFGVGAKSDVLALLLGTGGSAGGRRAGGTGLTARQMARELAYAAGTVKRVAHELALAGMVDESDEHPARYAGRGQAWAELLAPRGPRRATAGGATLPTWGQWAQRFALTAHALAWCERAAASAGSSGASAATDAADAADAAGTGGAADATSADATTGATTAERGLDGDTAIELQARALLDAQRGTWRGLGLDVGAANESQQGTRLSELVELLDALAQRLAQE